MKMAAISLTALITLVNSAHSNAEPALEKGTKDLSLFGSLDFTAPTGDTLNVNVGYGIFLQDKLSLRTTLQHSVQEDIAPGGADYRATEYNLETEYHFDFGWSIVPYAGANLGWRRSKFGAIRDDGIVYGGKAGAKYFIADNIAIDVALSYKLSDSDVYVSDYELENNKIFFGFGLRVMF